ncbi:hypothetical protein C7M84_019559 [Penaeus vannamei]|uniref:Uncharacterized protein n=1 Tax=Penaeus vannamei TaxID=6689 RepID=A0A3R7SIM0_PENVA|nr:hypothetical protein C7M84_019559 [Penaeus vannamei]
MVNREEESEDFHLPTPPEMSSAESSTEECIQTPERGETPVTGPWRVAEEAPPPPEDVNNLTWEHFPVIEDSPEEPQTPEEEVQEPSILSIGPHEITYKRKTTQDAEDTDTHSPLMKEVNACQHLIERVIGAIERMENIVARQDEQLTARSQGGQQLPQQSGTSQPHRSSWQGFQDHASQERRRKKRKPRKKQRKQQTQEDIRVQENAPQQREATSQPQRRRFRTQETTVEQRQDQRRNTWNPPQHHPQRNARVNRGRGTQQNTPQDFQRRPYPHQGFRRREWYPSHQRNTYRWQGQRNPTRKEDTTWETDTMVGQTIKRKLPVGNRKKRRKTVARRRSKQLGMELVGSSKAERKYGTTRCPQLSLGESGQFTKRPTTHKKALAGPVRQFLNEIWAWIKENSRDTPWETAFRTPPMIAWKKGKSIAEKLIRAQFPSPLAEHKE